MKYKFRLSALADYIGFGWCMLLLSGTPVLGQTSNSAILHWDANQENDLAGYRVYQGTGSGQYGLSHDVGMMTTYTVSNLDPTVTHYFAVTAYDQSGNESAPSEEVSHSFGEDLFALTVSIQGSGTVWSQPAGLSCEEGDCITDFSEGTIVTLTPTPSPGMNFNGWSGACSGTGNCVVTMDQARHVSATFTDNLPPPPPGSRFINFQPSSASVIPGYQMDDGTVYDMDRGYGWSWDLSGETRERGVNPDPRLDTSVMTFNRGMAAQWNYNLPNGDYLVTLASGDAQWPQNHRVMVEETLVFDDVQTTPNVFSFQSDLPVSVADGNLTITMGGGDEAYYTTLNFVIITPVDSPTPPPVPLTVKNVGNGTVMSNPSGLSCTTGTCTAEFAEGTLVTLTATPGSGMQFSGWSGACSGMGECVVTMEGAPAVTATFTPTPTVLTVAVAGPGQVTGTSSEGELVCSIDICAWELPTGTGVTLTATPGSGMQFSGWSGACSGMGECVVTMEGAPAVTATFTPTPTVLTVAVAGPGQVTGTSSEGELVCSIDICAWELPTGTGVTLTATPGSGMQFNGWSGACSGMSECVVTMEGAPAVTATFTPTPTVLTVAVAGPGQVTGTSSEGELVCSIDTCAWELPSGMAVTLTATPGSGMQFSGWSGACSGMGECVVTMEGTRQVTAIFSEVFPQPPLHVSVNFQPKRSIVSPGYLIDFGAQYDSARGYGWDQSQVVKKRERSTSVDQRLNTFLYVSWQQEATWEYAVPNGQYLLTLLSGDPDRRRGPQRILVEGIPLFTNITTGPGEFIYLTKVPIRVTDGQLSIQIGGTSGQTLLNFVEIISAD